MEHPAFDYPVVEFAMPAQWRNWLAEHYDKAPGVWLRFYKKNSAIKSITYDQALDEALCFGWIDSQVKKYDDQSYIQKFTPRKTKSIWSKRNTEHIERLIKEGKMHSAGLAQVAAAKQDGRWQAAYASPKTSVVPDDLKAAFKDSPKAEAFFQTITKANQYAILWRIETAKTPETRTKRIATIVAMLENGKVFHP